MEEEKQPVVDSPMQEDTQEYKERQIDFPLNLWGSLEAIRDNSVKGAYVLDGVITFTKSFHKAYEVYESSINKALGIFEKEMLKFSTLDTTMICMSSFSTEMKNMLQDMRDKIDEFDDLLFNPSRLFFQHYQDQTRKYYDISKKYLQKVELAKLLDTTDNNSLVPKISQIQ